jgi:hypothetical protein
MASGIPAEMGEVLARAEALAAGVSRRTRRVGRLGRSGGAAVWGLPLRAWVFDSWEASLWWSPLLLLLIPGLAPFSFARCSGKRARLPDVVGAGVGGGVGEGRAGLTALIGWPGDLREFGDEGRGLIAQVVGTARLPNPMYLALVGPASPAVIVVGLALVAALGISSSENCASRYPPRPWPMQHWKRPV